MAFGNHLAEILRQGLWASLTGGWYYDPSNSLFCNLLHLYLWLVLFLFPLLVGISNFSTAFVVTYVAFVVILFFVVKLIVAYMHRIFDTTEPIIVTKVKEPKKRADEAKKNRGVMRNTEGIYEMVEMRQQLERRAAEAAERLRMERRASAPTTTGETRTPSSLASIAVSSTNVSIEADVHARRMADTTTTHRATASELRNIETEDAEMSFAPRLVRKLSEPILSPHTPRQAQPGAVPEGSDGLRARPMLTASLCENLNRDSNCPSASTEWLPRPLQETHSDSPVMHLDDLCAQVVENISLVDEVERDAIEDMEEDEVSLDDIPSVKGSDWAEISPCENRITVDCKEEGGSRSSVTIGEERRVEESNPPSSSSSGGGHDLTLLNDSSLQMDDLPSTSRSQGTDVKAEITRFLEDLIDKHPETLDAIENVRQKRRRGQPDALEGTAVTAVVVPECGEGGEEGPRDGSSSSLGALSDLALATLGTHIASGPEDTSQGAVHSFQDEEGNWWTYAFDEQGVGTAQSLGSSRQLMELLCQQKVPQGLPSAASIHPLTAVRHRSRNLHVIPEAGSSDDEEGVERQERERRHRDVGGAGMERERAPSSSSNDSHSYLPHAPSSVFFAPPGRPRNAPMRNAGQGASLASRLRAAVRSHEERQQPNPIVMQLLEAEDRAEGEVHLWSQSSYARPTSNVERMMRLQDERERQVLGGRMRDFGLNQRGGDLQGGPIIDLISHRRISNTKKYYYRLKLFPFFTTSTVKVKMDRLWLAALFDRNSSSLSLIFDILMALCVSAVCSAVLQAAIYHDISLVIFCFVVAGSHFSLLKSVQPDASSPVHGFNWEVAYSRPFYLLVVACLLLAVNTFVPTDKNLIPWNWNVYRLPDTTREAIVLSIRDALASFLLFLPLFFTFGWMPQVSTLLHHTLEQLEMHVLGGTASFGPLSAALQILRSLSCLALLTAFSLLAHHTEHQTVFSLFAALLVQISFLQSRLSSNPHLWRLLVAGLRCSVAARPSSSPSKPSSRLLCGANSPLRDRNGNAAGGDSSDEADPSSHPTSPSARKRRSLVEENRDLPEAVLTAARLRFRQDLLFSFVLLLFAFALHCTSLFSAIQPYFTIGVVSITFTFGTINHYLYVQLRKHTPWKIIARPILRAAEFGVFESNTEAKLMLFETIHVSMLVVEKNLLYPLTVLAAISEPSLRSLPYSSWLLPLIGTRILRASFSHPQLVFIPLGLSAVISFVDTPAVPITWIFSQQMSAGTLFPLVFFVLTVLYPKWEELYLKLHFVLAYIAPWQITWGSAFHAFAQPFTVPHSVFIAVQTVLSSIISAPLNPFLGSSFITASYVRPVKFWERDYNTERADASNTRLASQIDRGPMLDDSNLNAVFYEHLTRSLQHSIAGDLALGRWGCSVRPGDCFVLASFYLNCLVHIIEVGNGFVTFQLRGLEFRGTYCHQREVEAISEDTSDGSGCCCCSPGSLPGILSLNTAWSLRWLAWEVTASKLIVDGYSITDNSAVNLLQVHELRRLLVTLFIRCISFYAITHEKIKEWMNNETIVAALEQIERNFRYVDVDHMFCSANDEDYDVDNGGISRQSFSRLHHPWILHCLSRNPTIIQSDSAGAMGRENRISALCLALSLLGRRTLGAASFNRHSNAAESFLYGLHALFRGDFRVTSARDEWVFADVDILRYVIAPSVRMALKLHQDHFAASEDLDDPKALYDLILEHQEHLFISHEHDPAWRLAIMENTPSLLALRHMYDDGQDDYKIIMLNRMHLNMRVIKLNRECVRAFWAGQQQELIFLRNRNPERGSIQNARQVLRNMINSSADQPVGYPIYVSPLTTSFIETHPQIHHVIGRPFTLQTVRGMLSSAWNGVRSHFGMRGSSSLPSTSAGCRPQPAPPSGQRDSRQPKNDEIPLQVLEQSVVQMTAEGTRVCLMKASGGDAPSPSTSAESADPLSGIITSRSQLDKHAIHCVEVIDEDQVFRSLSEPLKATGEPLVVWPNEAWRAQTNYRNALGGTRLAGLTGVVLHTWYPNHPNKLKRSHIGDKIHLVMLYDFPGIFIPIGEKGVRQIPDTFRDLRLDSTSRRGDPPAVRSASLPRPPTPPPPPSSIC